MTRSNLEKSKGFGSKTLLSIDEAAILLGITRSTAYRAIHNGTFPVPVIKLGGRLRISRAALDRVLSGDELTDNNIAGKGHSSPSICITCGVGLPASPDSSRSLPI